MSIIMTMQMKADGAKLEAWASANKEAMVGIVQNAERHGVIAHRFYTDGDGHIMVLDEWPDAASFQAFFAASQGEIMPMMAAAGVQSEPQPMVWHELETHDRFGWGAEAHAAH